MKLITLALTFTTLLWLSGCANNTEASVNDPSKTTLTNQNSATESPEKATAASGVPVHLTKADFLTKVYNYEKNPNEWEFAGDKPCIIDFYADWCKPCKMIAPILEDLAKEYDGKINVYKINTDQERELAQFFGIRSIPTLLFCPAKGDPKMAQGAIPRESFDKIIKEDLLGK